MATRFAGGPEQGDGFGRLFPARRGAGAGSHRAGAPW
jgi:hypothetical protein